MTDDRRPGEPDWKDGCVGAAGSECADCIVQREHYGYRLVDGAWTR